MSHTDLRIAAIAITCGLLAGWLTFSYILN